MENRALTVRPGGILPSRTDFDEMLAMADEFASSGILPKGIPPKRAAVLLVMQQGYELGIPPAAALATIGIVEGKPTLDAKMQRALIYRDHGGAAFRFVETDDQKCVIEYKRRDWAEAVRYTLTMAEVPQRLKSKQVWQDYPANMLRARATTFVAVMAFSDTTLGMYTPEEMGADVDVGPDGEPVVIAARVVDEDGVIHEPTSITLPLGLDAAQWAKLHTKATARGVDFDPRMTADQLAGAIKKAGGPRITGKINAGVLWSALDHVPQPDDDTDALPPEEAHIRAIAQEQPIPVSADAPIRDDEIVVERQPALVDGGR